MLCKSLAAEIDSEIHILLYCWLYLVYHSKKNYYIYVFDCSLLFAYSSACFFVCVYFNNIYLLTATTDRFDCLCKYIPIYVHTQISLTSFCEMRNINARRNGACQKATVLFMRSAKTYRFQTNKLAETFIYFTASKKLFATQRFNVPRFQIL